ncbi:MAG: PASTA domain-containing protein [Synergistaceae bacterium]|jgi:serine/threonine-protein kinase|nr:PASTA domain-containing protein [Synergistaceae bacterium]
MGKIFRLGIVIALLVLLVSSFMAARIIFVDEKEVDVPALVGVSAVEAANMLREAGLMARIDQVDSDQREGTVISQTPTAGNKVGRGRIVTIRTSRGGARSRIPDVRGLEFSAAVKALDEAGFKIGTVIRVSDSLKASGTVMAQNPASPAMVMNDRMVELLVSEGQTGKNEMVQVPDLKGQTEALARQILKQSDLSVSRVMTVESDQAPIGAVVRTQPRAGSRVPFGNAITLYIVKEPAVPKVLAEGDANGESPTPIIMTTREEPSPVNRTPEVNSISGGEPVRMAPPISVWDPRSTPAPATETRAEENQGGSERPAAEQESTRPVVAQGKAARVRYQVPPLSRPLPFRVEMTDQSGTRILRDQTVNGGEYLSMNEPYTGSATVTVRLGGEMVWQERYE